LCALPLAPSLSHFSYTDFADVYEPADDTFLFLDALRAERSPFLAERQPRICLELGCGSGALVTYLAMLLRGVSSAVCFASDVNAAATRAALRTARVNGVGVAPAAAAAAAAAGAATTAGMGDAGGAGARAGVVVGAGTEGPVGAAAVAAAEEEGGGRGQPPPPPPPPPPPQPQPERGRAQLVQAVEMDLFGGFAPHFWGSVDVLLFNPPYVPTPDDEVGGRGISAAWAGGEDGRVVIDRLLPLVGAMLSPRGVFYLLLVEDNRPEEIAALMRERYGFRAETVARRKARNEYLSVLKLWRG
jgi:methylase of polypeptide subunit release factors